MVDGPEGPGPKVDVPLQVLAFIALDEETAKDVEVGLCLSILGFWAGM
jgi:hypothetical protein